MRISVITLFPGFFSGILQTSIVARALEAGVVSVDLIDLRPYGKGIHRQVDDAPFGGGPGMVMMVEPIAQALAPLASGHKVLLGPAGVPLDQSHLDRLAGLSDLALVCGRYEGIDERVAEHLVDEEISLGDFVLAGGEIAAAAIVEGVIRLLPGVVGNPTSTETESFRNGLLEEPHYTRPQSFQGWQVPGVLLSGDHGRIADWRREQQIERTRRRRPDLGKSDS
ncbi:MAG: tRNA (guanosine(37)-N1)-methyltransferase TrmD [bacterium]